MVDAHQHLLSPADVEVWSKPALPAVALPNDLEALIREKARLCNDKAALAALYTEDARLLESSGPSWISGPARIAAFVATTCDPPYHVTPVAFGIDGSTAHIDGYLTEGAPGSTQHVAHLFLSLKKGEGARWRIAAETMTFGGPHTLKPLAADALVALLDAAGIQRALVLSVAYLYGDPRRTIEDEQAKVRAENDWTAQQVARFPDRLRAFCSFNPLRSYALDELERCAKNPSFRGIKLHFANSDVDLRSPEHVERVRQIFRAASDHRLPIVVHLRSFGRPYGRREAEIFLTQILPAAPDLPIQIAHLAGSGPGYEDPPADEALGVFADAITAGDPRTKNLYFDVATVVDVAITPEKAKLVAARIRQLGVQRVLYGSDMAMGGNLPPRQAWAVFRTALPLTQEELGTIAGNVPPYLR